MHKWDKRFLTLAMSVGSWSKDPNTKVGAVIVDPDDKNVLAVGYNGFPRKMNDDHRLGNRQLKNELTIHAEHNAILNSARYGVNISGSTIYITHNPCRDCAKYIIQSGIANVVYIDRSDDMHNDWRYSCAVGWDWMLEAGLGVIQVGDFFNGS